MKKAALMITLQFSNSPSSSTSLARLAIWHASQPKTCDIPTSLRIRCICRPLNQASENHSSPYTVYSQIATPFIAIRYRAPRTHSHGTPIDQLRARPITDRKTKEKENLPRTLLLFSARGCMMQRCISTSIAFAFRKMDSHETRDPGSNRTNDSRSRVSLDVRASAADNRGENTSIRQFG